VRPRADTPDLPHDEPSKVAAMFTRIAHRYDLLNHLLSLGFDRRWRKFAAYQTLLRPGDRALDVATGTGDFALELTKHVGQHGRVIGLDLTRKMLLYGHKKLKPAEKRVIYLHEGDAMRLPYRDNSFGAATMAFGGRNVPDLAGSFREMRRVVEPGGRVVHLELHRPSAWGFRHLFDWYFHTFSPLVGGMISGDRAAYEYLPRSVDNFESIEDISADMVSAGLIDVRFYRLTFGAAVVHVGTVPPG
jgi:demethylmenaquinone methyltransferase / 2-methoxy-6-polyprenyl-1,4-benzoquinol methylase